jgi:hypothetical protein
MARAVIQVKTTSGRKLTCTKNRRKYGIKAMLVLKILQDMRLMFNDDLLMRSTGSVQATPSQNWYLSVAVLSAGPRRCTIYRLCII